VYFTIFFYIQVKKIYRVGIYIAPRSFNTMLAFQYHLKCCDSSMMPLKQPGKFNWEVLEEPWLEQDGDNKEEEVTDGGPEDNFDDLLGIWGVKTEKVAPRNKGKEKAVMVEGAKKQRRGQNHKVE
jgi:hypothetical protein